MKFTVKYNLESNSKSSVNETFYTDNIAILYQIQYICHMCTHVAFIEQHNSKYIALAVLVVLVLQKHMKIKCCSKKHNCNRNVFDRYFVTKYIEPKKLVKWR